MHASMLSSLLDLTDLGWSSSVSMMVPTTRLTNCLNEVVLPCRLKRIYTIQSSKRSSGLVRTGLQKQNKKDLSRILRTEHAIQGIERKANSSKYSRLWPKAVLEALDEAIRDNQHDSAVKIFGLLRKQHWYEPRCQTYTKLLMMLGKCKQSAQASLLFELMLSEGLKPTIDVYTALVSAYCQSGHLDMALSIVESMKSVSDCKPDAYTYSILINYCTKFHHFEPIEHILFEMSYLGIQCSTVTYNTMIDGYGKAEMFEMMEKSLTDMIESGSSSPDIFTLNSIISAYGKKSKNIEKMEKWYEEFQLMGIKPDIVTFNILIGSYGKAKMFDKMSSVINYMEKRFFPPTVVTYNIVIDAYVKSGNTNKMEEYFLKMKHQGMKPNSITYCSLVKGYSEAGILLKIDSVLTQVCNSDVRLDTAFFNCIISAYGRVGDVEKMAELYGEMKGRKCRADYITYATMIQAYRAKGMVEAVKQLEEKMGSNQKELVGKKGTLEHTATKFTTNVAC